MIARVAASIRKWVHVGRVNSFKRHRYAEEVMDADSADGTLLTNGPDKHLPTVLGWTRQLLLEDAPSLVDVQALTGDPYDGRYQLWWRPSAEAPQPAPAPAPEVEQLTLI